MNEKGSVLIFILSVIGLLVLVSSVYVGFQYNKTKTPVEISVEQQLEESIVELYETKGSVTVSINSGNHIRGFLTLPNGTIQDFLAIRVSGKWRVVEYANAQYSCERSYKLNFPGDLVSDCVLEHDGALTVEQLLSIPKENRPKEVVILGKFLADDECDCIKIVSNSGETIVINSPNIVNSLGEIVSGDTVVVSGVITDTDENSPEINNPGSNKSGPASVVSDNSGPNTIAPVESFVLDASSIEEVSSEDDEIANNIGGSNTEDVDDSDEDGEGEEDSNSNENNSSQSDSNSDSNSNSTPVEPNVSQGSNNNGYDYYADYLNLLDIDKSPIPIQLIGD